MSLINNFKPLSIAQSSAANRSQQHQEKNSWKCQESNPGLLSEKLVCYLCAMDPPQKCILDATEGDSANVRSENFSFGNFSRHQKSYSRLQIFIFSLISTQKWNRRDISALILSSNDDSCCCCCCCCCCFCCCCC